MAVTKRTRFEVLRRDDYTCRYCGQCAPDVKITIDHVLPVALGGTDDPSNLAAACWDCNVGKASTKPDETTVTEVAEDALRFARLTKSAWEMRISKIDDEATYVDAVADAITFGVPEEWRTSIGRFYGMGVPLEVVLDAARIAADKFDPYGNTDRFKYMCGVIWNQAREVSSAVADRIDWDGQWLTDDELDEMLTSARIEGHQAGHRDGLERGWDKGWGHAFLAGDWSYSLLCASVDGTHEGVRRHFSRLDFDPLAKVDTCG